VALAVIGVLFAGCAARHVLRLRDTEVPNELTRLVLQQPEYFRSPLTLMVLLDTTPCGKAFTETIWWADWQKAALESGSGFVFATSKKDSADVAIAVELEGISAPILVLPSCPDTVLVLNLPRGALPMKVLIDRTGKTLYASGPIIDPDSSAALMRAVDSLSIVVANKN